MIRIPIRGGLGNQLFQISAVALLKKSGTKVRYFYPTSVAQGLQKEKFTDLIFELIGEYPMENLGPKLFTDSLGIRLKEELMSKVPKKFTRSPFENIMDLIAQEKTTGGLVEGYFQNNTMVDDSGIIIRLCELFGEKKVEGTVAHVRGGDYLQASNRFGKLTENYYSAAFRTLNVRGPSKIITNDIEFSARLLGDGVRNKILGGSTIEDFEAAIACARFVGSNSTYSWWVAKVRSALGRVSVMPSPLFPVSNQFSNHDLLSIKGLKLADSGFQKDYLSR